MPTNDNVSLEIKDTAAALKELRSCCDMTQRNFGTLVGAKLITIKKIEQGKRGIGTNLAEEISAATGVCGPALSRGELRSMAGRPYSTELFQRWTTLVISDQESRGAAMLFGPFCGALVEAAVMDSDKNPTPHRFRTLMVRLGSQFRELVALVGEERLNAQLRLEESGDEDTKTFKQWQTHFLEEIDYCKPKRLLVDSVADSIWKRLTMPPTRLKRRNRIPDDLAPNTRLHIRVTSYRYWDTEQASGPSGPPGTPSLPVQEKWKMTVRSREKEWTERTSANIPGFGLLCI
jgi:DNA-binding XRE family transcriptional regulator